MEEFVKIIEAHGPWIGIVAVLGSALGAYIRRDWKRLDSLESRVACLEDETRKTYASLIRQSQETLETTNKLLEKFLLRD